MIELTKAVLSKPQSEPVAPTREAWDTELNWRANYTGETAYQHALDEIIRLQNTLNELTKPEYKPV